MLVRMFFNDEIKVQASIAIDESDIVIFVVDGLDELNQNDFVIRDMLKKANKDVIVAVNKIDNTKRDNNIYNYYELGFEKVVAVSGEHNIGIDNLLEMITSNFKEINDVEYDDDRIKFCIIGRPNVGDRKSVV